MPDANSRCRSNRLTPAYILQRLACSERCQLDLPGFKNLEGLHIGMFLSTARRNEGDAVDVGRNKTTRRQPGWAFPAIGAPEKLPLLLTPITYIHVGNASLRLTRGQAYSGLRRDVYNDERFGVGTISA
jgi:hypothetical protein